MLQLKNKTPFSAGVAGFPDQQGVDSLLLTVKATYDLGPDPQIADKQAPILTEDAYWGEPGQSSLKYASEVHLTKPATDVMLIGLAQTPDRVSVRQLDVGLKVGDLQKVVRVFGDRRWENGLLAVSISQPEPFVAMPLTYEHAFGGVHEIDSEKGKILFEDRNPVGRGFVGKRSRSELNKFALPNLEDLAHPIVRPGDCPAPACFGPVAGAWRPRKNFVGTYDDAWRQNRAPYLPQDFDARFFNAAHPDLVAQGYLTGGEPVEVINAWAHGPIRCHIPSPGLQAEVQVAGKAEEPSLNLETVLIEPEENRLCLIWRAAVSCDKKLLQVEAVRVSFQHQP